MALYTVLPVGANKNYLAVYKSSDAGVSWSNMTQQVFPYEIKTLATIKDTGSLHIVTQRSDGRVAYHQFSTSTDAWLVQDQLISSVANADATYWGSAIVKRSNGELVVAFSGNSLGYPSYSRKVSGAWTAPTQIAASSVGIVGIAADSSSRVTFLFDGFTAVLTAANALSVSSATGANTGLGGQYGANGWIKGVGGQVLFKATETDTATEGGGETAFTATAMSTYGGQGAAVYALGDGSNKHALYVENSARSLWHVGNTGAGWSAASELAIGGDTSIGVGTEPQSTNSTRFVQGDGGTNERAAQSFTPEVATRIASVSVAAYKTGSPTDGIFVEIRDTRDGNVLATSQTISGGAGITTAILDAVKLVFKFSDLPVLSASTQYFFVVRRSGARDTTNYFRTVLTTGSYTGGGASSLNSGTWSAESTDLSFSVGTGVAAVSATLLTNSIAYLYDLGGYVQYGEMSLASRTGHLKTSAGLNKPFKTSSGVAKTIKDYLGVLAK